MIRVFHILEPIVVSGMAGNELVPQIDAQAIWIGFQRQGVAGILRGGRNSGWSLRSHEIAGRL